MQNIRNIQAKASIIKIHDHELSKAHDHDLSKSNPYNIAHFFASNTMAKIGLLCV